ncbi:hypothetical protein, partial [Sphingomonas sp.]|uniref:hypothetical protein n=1 Tax=Sphingomonas sp. TaxID=28214 RepID=UPI00345DC41F
MGTDAARAWGPMRFPTPAWPGGVGVRVERWLEAERGQLFLWVPVMIGAGIAAWFALPDATRWGAVILGGLAVAAAALAVGRSGRA